MNTEEDEFAGIEREQAMRKAMKQALEALDISSSILAGLSSHHQHKVLAAYTVLQAALATQPAQQEPAAELISHFGFVDGIIRFYGTENMEQLPIGTKFYTTPPAQPLTGGDERRHIICLCPDCTKPAQPAQRKPLTDEQMWALWNSQGDDAMKQTAAITFARAIEAAHNIKENNQ